MSVYTTGREEPETTKTAVARLRQKITQKWPEALGLASGKRELVFKTGLPRLDLLFRSGNRSGGIPCGQLIEITGGASSGKTSLLFFMLARWSQNRTIAYIDFGNSFFPDAAISAGIDLSHLLVIKPGNTTRGSGTGGSTTGGSGISGNAVCSNAISGIRSGEILLRERRADILVFDLIGQRPSRTEVALPVNLLHRLRLKTVRAGGLVIFLTQNNSEIIPSSMTSLRLETKRIGQNENNLEITIRKSRICAEGARLEVSL